MISRFFKAESILKSGLIYNQLFFLKCNNESSGYLRNILGPEKRITERIFFRLSIG